MVARYLLYDKKEALRYFRAKGDDKQAENACDLAYLKLRNEVMPRFVSTRLKCHVIQWQCPSKRKNCSGKWSGVLQQQFSKALRWLHGSIAFWCHFGQ
jgi:hypothetical protein